MKKGVKILGAAVTVVILLVVAATVGIKLYLTKDRVLGWVVPPLEEKLHRTVTIADVGAGLTGLYLDGLDVRVEGASDPLVATRRVQVSWNPWSLLSGTVEITEVRLVEPRIHVTKQSDGSLDIDDLAAAEPAEGTGGAKPRLASPSAEKSTGGGLPVAVVVGLFSLENGRVTYLDRSVVPEVSYVLDGIDARVTEISLDGPIPFELSANLPLAPAGRFTGSGIINVDTQTLDAAVRVVDFDLTALNEVLGEGIRFATGVLGVDLKVKLGPVQPAELGGEIRVTGLSLANGAATGTTSDVSLKLESSADLGAETAEVKSFTVSVGEQTLTGTARLQGWGKRPGLTFRLESEELQLDELLALLPAAEEAEEPAAGTAEAPAGDQTGKPAGVPLDAEGDIDIKVLRHGNVTMENLAVHVLLKDDQLQVEPVSAELYGGTVTATAVADLASAGPTFNATTHLEKVRVGKLLAAVDPKLKGSLTGTAFLDLTAQGVGGDLEALSSRTKLELKDGKLVSHPLVQKFTELFKVKEYRTLNFYSLFADVGTEAGVASVDSLVFRGDKLQATGRGTVGLVDPELDLRLVVALPRDVAAKVIGNRAVVDALTDGEGWTRLPLRLQGSPQQPRYGVDQVTLEKVAARALEDQGKKLLEEQLLKDAPLDEDTKGLLDQGLKSLFGR